MQFYKIEVDEKVWNYLKSKAEPFEDTPNSVLNRILFSERKTNLYKKNNEISKTNHPPFPNGIPKALAQILEVVYEVKVSGRNRNEATNLVGQRKGATPQTVTDKYCRQPKKRALFFQPTANRTNYYVRLINQYKFRQEVSDDF